MNSPSIESLQQPFQLSLSQQASEAGSESESESQIGQFEMEEGTESNGATFKEHKVKNDSEASTNNRHEAALMEALDLLSEYKNKYKKFENQNSMSSNFGIDAQLDTPTAIEKVLRAILASAQNGQKTGNTENSAQNNEPDNAIKHIYDWMFHPSTTENESHNNLSTIDTTDSTTDYYSYEKQEEMELYEEPQLCNVNYTTFTSRNDDGIMTGVEATIHDNGGHDHHHEETKKYNSHHDESLDPIVDQMNDTVLLSSSTDAASTHTNTENETSTTNTAIDTRASTSSHHYQVSNENKVYIKKLYSHLLPYGLLVASCSTPHPSSTNTTTSSTSSTLTTSHPSSNDMDLETTNQDDIYFNKTIWWNDTQEEEDEGYIVHKLTKSHLIQLENDFQTMLSAQLEDAEGLLQDGTLPSPGKTSLASENAGKDCSNDEEYEYNTVSQNEKQFEQDLKAAEDLLEKEEKRAKAVAKGVALGGKLEDVGAGNTVLATVGRPLNILSRIISGVTHTSHTNTPNMTTHQTSIHHINHHQDNDKYHDGYNHEHDEQQQQQQQQQQHDFDQYEEHDMHETEHESMDEDKTEEDMEEHEHTATPTVATAASAAITYEDDYHNNISLKHIKKIGFGKEGDLEQFVLPIVYNSFQTGFEPTKDLILEPGTIVAGQFLVESELGSAAFSTAYRCVDLSADPEDYYCEVCLKVIKNTKDFFDQSLDEIKVLELLRQTGECEENNILEMRSFFYYKEHLIIVTELLRQNLFEFGKFITDNDEVPYFTMTRLCYITRQALIALNFIHNLGLIHSDVKPENILIASYSRARVKLIDFGSSCFITDRQSSYIQSRSYRAPEVILGLPYDGKIDIWSLGCVVAEMFTGQVTFQNRSIVSMLSRTEAICGPFPRHLIMNGKYGSKFFTPNGLIYERKRKKQDTRNEDGESTDEVEEENISLNEGLEVSEEEWFHLYTPKRTTLAERLGFDADLMEKPRDTLEDEEKALFCDFVRSLLTIDPESRPTAAEALRHPWIVSGENLTEADIKYSPDES